jgi:hypothetical protein
MNFPEWEPVYEAILADFGFDRDGDEGARDLLATLARPFDPGRLGVRGKHVAVVGAGPSLQMEAERATAADVVFAASTAVDRLQEADVPVDLMVTDLDKNPETARALTESGVPVAVHAHGDNRPAVREWVPRFDRRHVLATTQAEPRGPVENFGGFTDGDRAAFLADHLGAARLSAPGRRRSSCGPNGSSTGSNAAGTSGSNSSTGDGRRSRRWNCRRTPVATPTESDGILPEAVCSIYR